MTRKSLSLLLVLPCILASPIDQETAATLPDNAQKVVRHKFTHILPHVNHPTMANPWMHQQQVPNHFNSFHIPDLMAQARHDKPSTGTAKALPDKISAFIPALAPHATIKKMTKTKKTKGQKESRQDNDSNGHGRTLAVPGQNQHSRSAAQMSRCTKSFNGR